jgi:flagellum-specific peptidoglycan hydrolase FlgJ
MATNQQCINFINEIGPIIRKRAKELGYKSCSCIIAQACVESAYGTSLLGNKYHNYFGMKCGSKWTGKSVNMKTKEEYTIGKLTSIRDDFRAYSDMKSGVDGYFQFISTSRYQNLKSAEDYKEYATLLKQDGYATSSTYINILCTTVKKWELDKRFDFVIYDIHKENEDYKFMKTIKKGDKGTTVRVWQAIIGIDTDSKFGPVCENTTKLWQSMHLLTPDGIVGPKTWEKALKNLD